jgi:branched-subunit amino acid ABC-type transport system permease component/ABC-type branched-subunit amino acid transport system substrate-binding protein
LPHRFDKRSWLAAIAGVAASISLAQAAPDPLKLGVLVPLTGATAADGERLLKAHELAAREINARGGIAALGGARIELVVADTQSKPETGRSEAERLISRRGVSAILGAWASAVTIPSMQVAERYRTPFIVTSAVTDSITEQGLQFVFRVSPKGSWAAKDVVEFIRYLRRKGVAIGRVALAYEDGPFGQTVSNGYKSTLPKHGLEIVAEESFRTGSPDLSTQAAKLKASGADLVLIVCYVDDETVLLRALAAQRYKPLVLGYGGGHVHPTLLQLGRTVEGSFGIVEWMPDVQKPATEAFAKAYEAAYGTPPLSNAAQAYAATWAVALAAEAAASRRPLELRDALRRLNVSEGPASLLPNDALAFDEHGQNQVGNVMSQVVDGRFVTVWPEAVASQPVRLPDHREQQVAVTLEVLFQAIVSGLANGAIYALVAVGLTLVFGVMRIVNFAHGEFLMIAMYGGYFAWALLGLDPIVAIALVTPALMLAGALLHVTVVRFALDAPEINQMAVTLGLSLLLQHLALVLFTGDNLLVTLPRSTEGIALGPAVMQVNQLLAAGFSIALLGVLAAILQRTDFGLVMRAVAQSRDGAALSGIDIGAVYRWAMAVGIGTLGVAGPLLVSILYVNPHVGALFTLKAFVIVIAGGLGSFRGALIGALLVCLAESISVTWLSASIAATVPFAILILVLLIKPEGLMSRGGRS